jgi:nucleotide-binding universal stress UspA family protein
VSEPLRNLVFRRILVALSASSPSLPALEAAVDLASRMQAELLGLFVEDTDLLRLAESPYACEFLYPSAREVPLSPASMESMLRNQAEWARKALAQAAERAKVRWSFRSVRGRVKAVITAASSEADLLAMGRAGWSLGRQLRIGPARAGHAAGAIPVILLPEQGGPPSPQWLVYYDSSPEAKRGLLAAAQLATAGPNAITVIIAAAKMELFVKLRKEAGTLLHGREIKVRYRRIDPEQEGSLVQAINEEGGGILVLGGMPADDETE